MEKLTPLYEPTLILHGGAGILSRSHLPPSLIAKYRTSLLAYLRSTRSLLQSGGLALDAAVHAVSLMEDDPLFNCGKGSVFNVAGEIEMEASVMVASVAGEGRDERGMRKKGAGVMLVKGTRHPVQLAREVLVADGTEGEGKGGNMHCQLSGEEVERWGWEDRGLERKGREWFWTKRRWEEHLKGLKPDERPSPSLSPLLAELDAPYGTSNPKKGIPVEGEEDDDDDDFDYRALSQGTVGAVCLDQHGNLAVATSTGGLTNKNVGRIGDTPTLGAGFWAESWDEEEDHNHNHNHLSMRTEPPHRRLSLPLSWADHYHSLHSLLSTVKSSLSDCLPSFSFIHPPHSPPRLPSTFPPQSYPYPYYPLLPPSKPPLPPPKHRTHALALSGTGNGDSFLRLSACRTAAALCRFSSPSPKSPPNPSPSPHPSLSSAVTLISGPNGELQRSAGDRWGSTGEGVGGIIGIEICEGKGKGEVVWDFNAGGMWRAYVDGWGREVVGVWREDGRWVMDGW
ncbi:MAG: hypothetical protein Q9227_002300 [Pyrenula ochraceoflavens]